MVSWGSAVITALPCPSSCVAAESAWESADTVWSISTAFVSGWELVVAALPKLAANRKVSLAWVPVPAGEADAVWVVALCVESLVAACVLVVVLAAAGDADAVWVVALCVESLVAACVFVVVLAAAGDADAVWVVALCVESFVAACVFVVVLASTTVVVAVADVSPEELEVVADVAACIMLGSSAE